MGTTLIIIRKFKMYCRNYTRTISHVLCNQYQYQYQYNYYPGGHLANWLLCRDSSNKHKTQTQNLHWEWDKHGRIQL